MAKERIYTQSGYNALLNKKKELEAKIDENLKDISTARSFGDLSENSEYSEAKEMQKTLHVEMDDLEELIKNAVIVDESEADASIVGIGSIVTVHHVERSKDVTYHIVGSYEADPFNGKISDQSPIGAALLGKKEGEVAEAPLPNGSVAHLNILSVKRV